MTGRPAPPAPPFDAAAAAYDRDFTSRPLPRLLREAAWEHLERAFRPGDRVLDLGCGTGEDAVRLATRGVRVTAVDVSLAMLQEAGRKAEAAGVAHWVELVQADLEGGEAPGEGGPAFDGAYSSFGAVNCLPDRGALAASLSRRVRPGGSVLLMAMGPFCPWEIGWHLLRLQPGRAFRRFRSGAEARVGEPPRPVRVWYPTPARLRRDFRPWFDPVGTVGIGVVLPPPYLAPLVEPRPGLMTRMARLDRWAGRRPGGSWVADHYLLLLRRREGPWPP